MTQSQTEAQTRNAARIDRDGRGRELADVSRRAARSVRKLGRLRCQVRCYELHRRDHMLPNNGGLDLWLRAPRLIEKSADIAVAVVIDATTGSEGRYSGSVLTSRQRKMVVMTVFRDQLMQPIPQHRDTAINGEQYSGDKFLGNSPHGGITPQSFLGSLYSVDPSRNRPLGQQKYARSATLPTATDVPTARPTASV
jgi:hypothetical protein